MRRGRAKRAGVHGAGVGDIDEAGGREHGAGQMRGMGLGRAGEGGQQPLGRGIREADGDAVERRVGVEGQPRRAGPGDGDLGDQQFRAARHPQADDIAGAHAPAQ